MNKNQINATIKLILQYQHAMKANMSLDEWRLKLERIYPDNECPLYEAFQSNNSSENCNNCPGGFPNTEPSPITLKCFSHQIKKYRKSDDKKLQQERVDYFIDILLAKGMKIAELEAQGIIING